ncbi:Uncharacterised protein [Escherichia coli]|uniref:Uncharacterized protein n=1 Tax=Escherichia coli TaxID=562 RepID=A0A376VS88_ECOLX|nr:Uncharacterised protein [Escherichia coli]
MAIENKLSDKTVKESCRKTAGQTKNNSGWARVVCACKHGWGDQLCFLLSSWWQGIPSGMAYTWSLS